MILHGHELCPDTYSIRLLLALSGASAEHRVVDILAIGPEVVAPVLEDGSTTIKVFASALVHVAEKIAPARLAGAGDVGESAAASVCRLRGEFEAANRLRNGRLFGWLHDEVADLAATRAAYRRLDDRLIALAHAGRPFLGGREPGVLDLAVFPLVALADDVGVPLDRFHGLSAWVDRIVARPGFVPMPGILALPAPGA